MKKRNFILINLLTLSLMFACFTISYADPSQLIVVRATDNSLWKATCEGTTCTGFTSFPGMFTTQPAVIWDENIQRYVLWGRGTDGAIWRSTFSRLGTFQNDWSIPIPGSTPSPPGAAGGGIASNMWFSGPTTTLVALTGTIVNLRGTFIQCPWDGYVVATSSGTIEHNRSSASGNVFARIFLTETSGGTATTWSFTDLPNNTPIGATSFPYSLTRSFSCPADGGNKYVYVTGEEGGSAAATTTTTVHAPTLFFQYFPYSF